MARVFILFLMLVVVFLAGMLLGMDRGHVAPVREMETQIYDETAENEPETENAQTENDQPPEDLYIDETDGPAHLTQKAASILGSAVSGFYNLIVHMLYQVSSLFY